MGCSSSTLLKTVEAILVVCVCVVENERKRFTWEKLFRWRESLTNVVNCKAQRWIVMKTAPVQGGLYRRGGSQAPPTVVLACAVGGGVIKSVGGGGIAELPPSATMGIGAGVAALCPRLLLSRCVGSRLYVRGGYTTQKICRLAAVPTVLGPTDLDRRFKFAPAKSPANPIGKSAPTFSLPS